MLELFNVTELAQKKIFFSQTSQFSQDILSGKTLLK